jgi:hypothetical protein
VRIFVEGPHWSGEWTGISVATLEQLGHQVEFLYHNRRGLIDRIALAAGRLIRPAESRGAAWTRRYQQQLYDRMRNTGWDVLFSIQGRVQADTVRRLRRLSPDLRVIYWWGDIITEQARRRLVEATEFSDRVLVSYHGAFDRLKAVYGEKIAYFPFGVSARFHQVQALSRRDRQRYTADVALVGTCYPERCELVHYLNTRLAKPVQVWGRGWRHCRGVRSHGPLALADTLKVYACSGVSVNLHHRGTDNGFNMKFYEIPAAGGFQICDWQPAMEVTALGTQTVSCRSPAEFAETITHYLEHAQERQRISEQTATTVFAHESYLPRLEKLLASLPGE